MAHAYLVHGDNAEVREKFARTVAAIAVCPQVQPDGSPCEQCKTCRQIANDTYPELYVLSPSGRGRVIPVGDSHNPEPDTVRWFEDLFYLTSTSGAGKKIGIIQDADRMRNEAQNVFLKTLEEPPADTIFILTTGNPASLLPTTRSRCQLLPVLENQCAYDFDAATPLFQTLYQLQFESNNQLSNAERCAEKIIGLSAMLQQEAADFSCQKWRKRRELLENLIEENDDRNTRKMLKDAEDREQTDQRAEYLRLRTYFLSAIHTWFAQIWQLSRGTEKNQLPNPEIIDCAGRELPELDETRTYQQFQYAEELLNILKWTVKEELALRTFCLNVALP